MRAPGVAAGNLDEGEAHLIREAVHGEALGAPWIAEWW